MHDAEMRVGLGVMDSPKRLITIRDQHLAARVAREALRRGQLTLSKTLSDLAIERLTQIETDLERSQNQQRSHYQPIASTG